VLGCMFQQKQEWRTKRICSEFRREKWSVGFANSSEKLTKLIQLNLEQKAGSGRPRYVLKQRNISRELIYSQQDNHGTSKSPRRSIKKLSGPSVAALCGVDMRYKNRCTLCHCVSSVTVVLNNHLTFRDKNGCHPALK